MLLLCLCIATMGPLPQATQTAYCQQDAEKLRALFQRADSRADSLLIRYRLYPLTEDESTIKGIPSSLSDGSAREYALLSGLWAYRAGEALFLSAMRYGRRSVRLLEKAKSINRNAPFVLLVEGQSLLFRPAIAGRDPNAAVQRFTQLRRIVQNRSGIGISKIEAQVWRWMSLREAERRREAQTLLESLREQTLPPLYRQFLDDPPEL